jgi:hypothetical protein
VLALLAAGAELPPLPDGCRLVRADSGYEAAAEMLAEPAAAFVVDLARITPTHTGLLELAASMRLPIIAYGRPAAELDASATRGLRLVEPGHVGRAVADAVSEVEPPATEAADHAAVETPVGTYQPVTEPEQQALDWDLIEDFPPAQPGEEPEAAEQPGPEERRPLQPQSSSFETEPAREPGPAAERSLLTDEDIRRLLEDQA